MLAQARAGALSRTSFSRFYHDVGESGIPLRGWSEADGEGAPPHEPETNQVFISELKRLFRPQIEVIEVDTPINEPEFADAAVATLDGMMRRGQ